MSIKKFMAIAAIVAMPAMATAGGPGTAPSDDQVDDPLPVAGSLGSAGGVGALALGVGVLAVVAAAANAGSSGDS